MKVFNTGEYVEGEIEDTATEVDEIPTVEEEDD